MSNNPLEAVTQAVNSLVTALKLPDESAKANEDYDVTVFTCPACGGEIESTENEIIQFCPFCGAGICSFLSLPK